MGRAAVELSGMGEVVGCVLVEGAREKLGKKRLVKMRAAAMATRMVPSNKGEAG